MTPEEKQQIADFLRKYPVREACLALKEGGLIFIKLHGVEIDGRNCER